MAKSYLTLILVGALMTALYISAFSVLAFNLIPPLQPAMDVSVKTPTVNILLYMGEMPNGKSGFGYSPNNLTSPGPTIQFSTQDIVRITVVNVGAKPHAFAIANMPSASGTVMFNGAIGSTANPLQSGEQGSVVFNPNNAGYSYCYLSPITGDVEAGMLGTVVITAGS